LPRGRDRWGPLIITSVYLLFGGAWIVLSDAAMLFVFGHDARTMAVVGVVKGFAFVTLSGVLIYLLMGQRERVLARQAEASAELERASTARIEVLTRLSPAIIFRTDACGQTTYLNERWTELTGAEIDAGLGDAWIHGVHPDDRAALVEAWRRAVREAGRFEEEYRFVRPDGRETWVLSQAEPERDARGAVVGFVGAVTDITARRRAEQEVRAFAAELERRVEERTAELEASAQELAAFSSSVSHDLRAPLRSIAGFTGSVLADHGDALPDDARSSLLRVLSAAGRMSDVIDSQLVLARVSRGELLRADVDGSALAAEVVDDLRAQAPTRAVEVEIAPDIRLYADPKLLRIVFENLLANAWKFTGERPDARVVVTAEHGDGETVLHVRDNGAGFDETWSRKLFQPFERLHSTERFPGTGIGLATVARIVARHGGRVWAHGTVGAGATFSLALPLAPPPLEAPAIPPHPRS